MTERVTVTGASKRLETDVGLSCFARSPAARRMRSSSPTAALSQRTRFRQKQS